MVGGKVQKITKKMNNKFEVGDEVICLPTSEIGYLNPGSGYRPGFKFIIRDIDRYKDGDVIWPKEGNGIFSRVLSLVKRESISYEIY